MARLVADENFPLPVLELRRLGKEQLSWLDQRGRAPKKASAGA